MTEEDLKSCTWRNTVHVDGRDSGGKYGLWRSWCVEHPEIVRFRKIYAAGSREWFTINGTPYATLALVAAAMPDEVA